MRLMTAGASSSAATRLFFLDLPCEELGQLRAVLVLVAAQVELAAVDASISVSASLRSSAVHRAAPDLVLEVAGLLHLALVRQQRHGQHAAGRPDDRDLGAAGEDHLGDGLAILVLHRVEDDRVRLLGDLAVRDQEVAAAAEVERVDRPGT